MAQTRVLNAEGQLTKLTVDTTDVELTIAVGSLARVIPVAVAAIRYQELDSAGVVTKSIQKTRAQLLVANNVATYVYTFTYYEKGEIDTIRIRTFNDNAVKLSDMVLKHYAGGEQPEFL